MIFVNFKTYPEATGEKAVALAHACQEVQAKSGIAIRLCVQAADINSVAQQTDLPVWAQHIDPVSPNRATGFTTAFAIRRAGAWGTLVNHSEHPLEFSELKEAVSLAKAEELEVLVFVKDLKEAKAVSRLEPEFIALEEPSLIATGKAMVENPEGKAKIEEFLSGGLSSYLLVGAGITTREDVAESVRLGAKGIVITSAVVLAQNPQKVLEELALGFK